MSSRNSYGDVTHRELLEAENDRLVENLGSKVSALHGVAVDIYKETEGQNKYLDDNSDHFDTAKSLLTGSFSRVKHMNQQTSQNCKIMCYFSIFAIVIFFLCYFLMGRVGRSSD